MAFTPAYSLSANTNPSFIEREIAGDLNALNNTDSAALAPDRSSGNTKREQAKALTLQRTVAGVHATPKRALWNNLAVAAVTGTGEATLLDATGNGNLAIPAGFLVAGAVYELELSGIITTDSSGTLTFKGYLGATGATALVTGAAITTVASQTDDHWNAKVRFQVLTAGASGKVIASGLAVIEQSTRKLAKLQTAAAGATVDLSVDNLLKFTATFSAGAANVISVLNGSLSRVR